MHFKYKLLVFVAILAPISLECILRTREDIRFELEYRRAHCLFDSVILLCPNKKSQLRAGSRVFTLTTNERGERISAADATGTPVVVFGDSLSMGYGLSDEETVPFLLSQSGLPALNLAVDSLGPSGMELVLRNRSPEDVRAYVWVFSPSDFVDEGKPGRNAVIGFVYKIYFWARKHLAVLALLRRGSEQPVSESMPVAPPALDHPAWTVMDRIFQNYRPLILLFYPAAPGASMVVERRVADFARERGVKVLWLEAEFREAVSQGKSAELFIPDDGHPGPLAARLFTSAVLSSIQ
ncbi:MAG: hypothetical protein HS115_07250 [Spirochaetales bacterium]|nr:hypothetical protein [Spirochaetales bacterium]